MKTIKDYITSARILLQDTVDMPYRYADADFQLALDLALDEAFRIRPDLFIKVAVTSMVGADIETAEPPIPRGYQSAFLYYITGHVQLRDDEATTDARASTLLNKFIAQLLTTAA